MVRRRGKRKRWSLVQGRGREQDEDPWVFSGDILTEMSNGSKSDNMSQVREHRLGKFSTVFHTLLCPERVALFLTYISKKAQQLLMLSIQAMFRRRRSVRNS